MSARQQIASSPDVIEMAKRVLKVAEILAKGLQKDQTSTIEQPRVEEKTQDTKIVVSS